jgi:hypothetical protein
MQARGQASGLNSFASLIAGPDALALLEHETRLVSVDHDALDRDVEKLARRNKRQHQNKSLAYLKMRVLCLLARCLADENPRAPDQSLSNVRAQALYDLGPSWRTCLRKRAAWADVAPRPRWHNWA